MQKLQCTLTALASTAALSLASAANAAILFDFGSVDGAGAYSVDATANPDLGGPAGLTGTVHWNSVYGADSDSVSDVASGLVDSSNAALTGVSLDLGTGSDTSINWASQPKARVGWGAGGRSSTGVFANDTFRDFIANESSESTIGLRISGLDAGTYDVWVISRMTYTNNDDITNDDYDIYVGAGGTSTAPNSLSTDSIQQYSRNNASANTDTWAEGDGFTWVKLQATVDGSNDLLVFSESTYNNQNGLINAVQVSLVPEPASLALMGLGSMLMFVRRRRGTDG
ncbi:MAG: PEP-CTERM sorting domain-containing protein [Phycisphaeraceae bacterium]